MTLCNAVQSTHSDPLNVLNGPEMSKAPCCQDKSIQGLTCNWSSLDCLHIKKEKKKRKLALEGCTCLIIVLIKHVRAVNIKKGQIVSQCCLLFDFTSEQLLLSRNPSMMSVAALWLTQGNSSSVYGPLFKQVNTGLQCSSSFRISGSNEPAIQDHVIIFGRGQREEAQTVTH